MSDSPDTTDKAVRFGCGFVFGLVICAASMFVFFLSFDKSALVAVLLTAVVFGALSVRYGDAFWRWVSRNWRVLLFWS